MNIKETFLKLTSKTYPHGTEDQLIPLLPSGVDMDLCGNYFIKVGESNTMFTCHLDTCCSNQEVVNHQFDGHFIKTDGTTILGADDKAGMTVLLYMIENNIPGLYYFFVGEEVGCVGSSDASVSIDFSKYKKCISFDRRGYDSVITDQLWGVCCSDEFATTLSNELNKCDNLFGFRPDPTGVVTDSAQFVDYISECTNISVGYMNEHKLIEQQDIEFLERLCKACVQVDWDSLPISRTPGYSGYYTPKKSYKTYDDFDDCVDTTYSIQNEDDDFDVKILSGVLTVWIDKLKWTARLKNRRIIEERGFIYEWAMNQGYFYGITAVEWDGLSCSIEYANRSEYIGERQELMHIVDKLSEIPLDDLNLIERI
jgi:hypothetical protein